MQETTYSNGYATHWRVNGKLHRTDGPAIEWADGRKSWHLNGLRHRVDGPAIEDIDGYKAWWLNDVEYETIGAFCCAAKMTPEETTIFLLKWG